LPSDLKKLGREGEVRRRGKKEGRRGKEEMEEDEGKGEEATAV